MSHYIRHGDYGFYRTLVNFVHLIKPINHLFKRYEEFSMRISGMIYKPSPYDRTFIIADLFDWIWDDPSFPEIDKCSALMDFEF